MRGKTTILAVLVVALVCAISANAQGKGQGQGGGGGEPTGYGNNLSYPVVFAEGYGITGLTLEGLSWSNPSDPNAVLPDAGDNTGLRPFAGELFDTFPYFVEPYPANPDYYAQNTVNTWRAEWTVGTTGSPELVQVDWGDNLISQSWTVTQPVRVETVLRQPVPMVGYPMSSLLGSRRSEIIGTTGDAEASLGRTVYTRTAHLLIDKYDETWTNKIENGCSVDVNVYDTVADGPGGYSAEVNVGGSLIYGYNWMLSQCNASPDSTKAGNWRITFQIDPSTSTTNGITSNVKITDVADMSSAITTVNWDKTSGKWASLDITILDTRPKGGKRPNR